MEKEGKGISMIGSIFNDASRGEKDIQKIRSVICVFYSIYCTIHRSGVFLISRQVVLFPVRKAMTIENSEGRIRDHGQSAVTNALLPYRPSK